MALSLPCPVAIRGCVCTNDPISNYSSEDPDNPVCYGHYTQPPTAGSFFNPGCFGECDTVLTTTEDDCQVIAQECAERAALDCSNDPPTPPQPPGKPPVTFNRAVFQNDFQSCTVECPDGATFTESVPAGVFKSFWKEDADARAHGLDR